MLPKDILLWKACSQGELYSVEYMISKGAVVSHLAIIAAIRGNFVDCLQLLLQHVPCPDRQMLSIACDQSVTDPQILEVLYREDYTGTPLLFAAEKGNLPAINFLLSKTNRRGLFEKTPEGLTALHVAASKGHREVVCTLLRWGFNVNYNDNIRGDTPLHCAVLADQMECVRHLVESGYKICLDIKNKNGYTSYDCSESMVMWRYFTDLGCESSKGSPSVRSSSI